MTTLNAKQAQALLEPTELLMERAATMHQQMLANGSGATLSEHGVDRAVLHLYKTHDSVEHAAALFNATAAHILERQNFFECIANTFGVPPATIVAEHLLQTEVDDTRSRRHFFRRTPDTAL